MSTIKIEEQPIIARKVWKGDQTIHSFNTMKEAADAFGISWESVFHALHDKRPGNGYMFTHVGQDFPEWPRFSLT